MEAAVQGTSKCQTIKMEIDRNDEINFKLLVAEGEYM